MFGLQNDFADLYTKIPEVLFWSNSLVTVYNLFLNPIKKYQKSSTKFNLAHKLMQVQLNTRTYLSLKSGKNTFVCKTYSVYKVSRISSGTGSNEAQ